MQGTKYPTTEGIQRYQEELRERVNELRTEIAEHEQALERARDELAIVEVLREQLQPKVGA